MRPLGLLFVSASNIFPGLKKGEILLLPIFHEASATILTTSRKNANKTSR
jgi:hypothetical protein